MEHPGALAAAAVTEPPVEARLIRFDRVRDLLVATALPPVPDVYDLLWRYAGGDDFAVDRERITAHPLRIAKPVESFVVLQDRSGNFRAGPGQVEKNPMPDQRMYGDMAPCLGIEPGTGLEVGRVDVELTDVVQQPRQHQHAMAVDFAGQQPARQ